MTEMRERARLECTDLGILHSDDLARKEAME